MAAPLDRSAVAMRNDLACVMRTSIHSAHTMLVSAPEGSQRRPRPPEVPTRLRPRRIESAGRSRVAVRSSGLLRGGTWTPAPSRLVGCSVAELVLLARAARAGGVARRLLRAGHRRG